MMPTLNTLLAIYAVGVIIGLVVMRDRWVERIITAAAWPLGVLAFFVVLAIQIPAAAYLWPIPVFATAAVVALVWFAL
jgi:hypothetical protein